MVGYYMMLLIYTRIFPIFIPVFASLMATVVVPKSEQMCDAETETNCEEEPCATDIALSKLTIVAAIFGVIILFGMYVHGKYCIIKSKVYSIHLVIARDGINAVEDNHLEGRAFRAAVHCCDTCLLVTRKNEVVSAGGFFFLAILFQ